MIATTLIKYWPIINRMHIILLTASWPQLNACFFFAVTNSFNTHSFTSILIRTSGGIGNHLPTNVWNIISTTLIKYWHIFAFYCQYDGYYIDDRAMIPAQYLLFFSYYYKRNRYGGSFWEVIGVPTTIKYFFVVGIHSEIIKYKFLHLFVHTDPDPNIRRNWQSFGWMNNKIKQQMCE